MRKWLPVVATCIAASAYMFVPHLRAHYRNTHILTKTEDDGVLLTFDDGVHPLYTPQLLDLLQQYNIRAIFFIVGERAARYPHIVEMIAARGHVLGIHHYTHVSTFTLTKKALYTEVMATKALLERLSNQEVILYRPPFGHVSRAAFSLRDVHIMLWSGIFGDWHIQPPMELAQALHAASAPGAIFVLHDSGENKGADDEAPAYMIEALAQFIANASYPFTDARKWVATHVDRR